MWRSFPRASWHAIISKAGRDRSNSEVVNVRLYDPTGTHRFFCWGSSYNRIPAKPIGPVWITSLTGLLGSKFITSIPPKMWAARSLTS